MRLRSSRGLARKNRSRGGSGTCCRSRTITGPVPGEVGNTPKSSAAPHSDRAFLEIGEAKARCCTTLTLDDSHRESMWMEMRHEQAIIRPLRHHELARLDRLTEEAWFFADPAGQGDGMARAA